MERGHHHYENEHKHHPHEHAKGQRLALGLVLVGLGAAFLFRNTGLMPDFISRVIFSWPMVIVAIGIVMLGGRNRIMGLVLFLLGGAFLIPLFLDIDFNFRAVFWPTLLIGIGLVMILKNRDNFIKKQSTFDVKDDFIDEVAVFGGGEKKIVNPNFKGGKVTAVFGGSELDLTQSQLALGENILDITAVFGGVTLIVPANWYIKPNVAAVFGGFTDKRPTMMMEQDPDRVLIIKGATVFGGGEIKSYK